MIKAKHKLQLITARILLAVILLEVFLETLDYGFIFFFGAENWGYFLFGASAALFLAKPPREVLENYPLVKLPLKMPYKLRKFTVVVVLIVGLTFLAEKQTSLNLSNFSDIINFSTAMFICIVVGVIVYPGQHAILQEAKKLRRPKSLGLGFVNNNDVTNTIAVPVTLEALSRFEYDECIEGDLIERSFDDKDCAELFDTGVFVEINSNLNMIVDWNEKSEILGLEKLSVARNIVDDYFRKHPNNQILKLLHNQITYAEKHQTGVYFYF